MPSAHPLIDHEEIRAWAEERGARPACVRRTGGKGDPGMIRLDFPGFSGAQSLSPLPWPKWFKAFDDNNLALLVQDRTARGQQSNFNKLVSRESVLGDAEPRGRRKQGGGSRSRSGSSGGGRKRKASGARKSSRNGGSASRSTSASGGSRSASGNRGGSRSSSRSAKGSSRASGGSGSRKSASASRGRKQARSGGSRKRGR